MQNNNVVCADCLETLKKMKTEKIDLIYLDPPFFTQNIQSLVSSKKNEKFSFCDKWKDMDEYLKFMEVRLEECKRVLKDTGSIFVHCDRNASHYLKVLLDKIFGTQYFQSEIIWFYKRWSNSKKGLLNNHQVILFYSKTSNFKFNRIYTDYSETTNVDQILQDRIKDKNGKSKYKIDENGESVIGKSKKGVPLSDVWEIPYLNPKAKERVGYPTQKPLILLEQIIKLVTEEGDIVLDPFVGSGTTVVAAKMLKRGYLGIDISQEAVDLTKERLEKLVKTESFLLKKGRASYQKQTEQQVELLKMIGAIPVQRNNGIDGFLKEYIDGKPVSVKIQKQDETLDEAVSKLIKASKTKKCIYMILIRTHVDRINTFDFEKNTEGLILLDSYEMQIHEKIDLREDCAI
ncbi:MULTISPECIES: site-specific DNA-methyltransferase [unclassified Bacillota]|nr:site-specific DNA-methyltransferase [Firmicutes bacterium AM10-47]RHV45195.1 site-specific DNA-methyltransferase [Firmicutes bacterium OM04-13BH]